jgi:hypothetical protein
MNFQEKMFEATTDLRTRALSLADAAIKRARGRAEVAAKRVKGLKSSLAVLTVAGRELNKVTRRHVARFVKESSTIAKDASKDVAAVARSTYTSLAKRNATKSKTTRARKSAATRKRTATKAA